jgi:hypothetical protein
MGVFTVIAVIPEHKVFIRGDYDTGITIGRRLPDIRFI